MSDPGTNPSVYVPPSRRVGRGASSSTHPVPGGFGRGTVFSTTKAPRPPSTSRSWRGRGDENQVISPNTEWRNPGGDNNATSWRDGRGFRGGGRGRGRSNGSAGRSNFEYEDKKGVPLQSDAKASGDSRNADKRPVFGFRRVEGLLGKPDSEDGIASIVRDLDSWVTFLESDVVISAPPSRNGEDDLLLRMLMHLLGSCICSNNVLLPEYQNSIILATLNAPKFLLKVQKKLNEIMLSILQSFGNMRSVNSNKNSDSSSWNQPKNFDASTKGFIKDIYDFCSFVAKRLPESARDYLKNTLVATSYVLVMTTKEMDPSTAELEEPLKSLIAQLESFSKREEAKKVLQTKRRGPTEEHWAYLDAMEPPTDFREMTVVPSIEELRTERKEGLFLRRNKPSGGYASADDYLDVQFRLLREDFVSPLREGIQEYLRHPLDYSRRQKKMPLGSIRLYHGVQILGSELVKGVTHFWLQLPPAFTRRVKWGSSKRLLQGSLLVLSRDSFKSATFGVVGIRDDKLLSNKGQISFIPEAERPLFNELEEFLLVECEVYFEAYRHVLKTLQSLNLACFPLSKFIVDANDHVKPPGYLQTGHPEQPALNEDSEDDGEEEEPELQMRLILPPKKEAVVNDTQKSNNAEMDFFDEDFEQAALDQLAEMLENKDRQVETKLQEIEKGRMIINPMTEKDWPSPEDLGLDKNQFMAFKGALTQEFCIIQGPPGTGKTYLGLRITEILLENKKLWMDRSIGPIVVVTYTNHALDQFLEGILDLFEKKHEHEEMERQRELAPEAYTRRPLPPAPIVRMGGRNKSEKLKQYELYNVRWSSEWRAPPEIYKLRQDGENEVWYLSQRVAHITAQWRGLGELNGIPNFRCLHIWDELSEQFPPSLWECLHNQDFFEITNRLLSTPNLDEKGMVNHWFGKNPNSRLLSQKNIKRQGKENEPTPEEELLDDEDYDMEELMEIRTPAEPYEPRYRPQDDYRALNFISSLSINDCDRLESVLESELLRTIDENNSANIEPLKLQQMEIKMEEIRALRRENGTRRRLLEATFSRVRELTVNKTKVAEKVEDLWGYKIDWNRSFPTITERWEVLLTVMGRARELLLHRKDAQEKKLIVAERGLADVRRYADSQVLKHCQVVGMTTTGAAKQYDILRNLNSKIVIVEEAAEVLEAHIVTCLTQSCQHLILIGDHLQLKPSTTVYQLATKYNLDVSLFERMINNKLSLYPLKVQHRMRPEISDLVRDTIYAELEDSPSVLLQPTVRGVSENVFFITHNQLEASDADSMSKSNEFEAEYLLGLCRYLIIQGYSSSQITILSTYTGQMFLLKKKFRDLEAVRGVRITCVDNFQGEENDIILLSLVRSNVEGAVGFLKVENRVCVALSRAKHGMFIVGNMEMLCEGSKIWPKIKEKLGKSRFGKGLPIICRNHGTLRKIADGSEFGRQAPEGGCTVPCNTILSRCGHKCPKTCHVVDSDHLKYICIERCVKSCLEEPAHPCKDFCYKEECSPCKYSVTIVLQPCGHEFIALCHDQRKAHLCPKNVFKELVCGHLSPEMRCHKDPALIRCEELVEKMPICNKHVTKMPCWMDAFNFKCLIEEEKFLPCGHKKGLKCHEDENEIRCKAQVLKRLPCGHDQMDVCHLSVEDVKCDAEVHKMLKCGHKEKVLCKHKDNTTIRCSHNCTTRLKCGHACRRICHLDDDPQHLYYECRKPCCRSCDSGHKCAIEHECYRSCPPCRVQVVKDLPCTHSAKLECHLKPVMFKSCVQPCCKILPCGHPCDQRCSQKCGPCMVKKAKTVPGCGHINVLPCSETPSRDKCEVKTDAKTVSNCDHEVLVLCKLANSLTSEEVQQLCDEKCTHTFPHAEDGGCGHKCKGTCGGCSGGSFHQKCASKCGRVLVCGHICEFPCANDCPPCQQKCVMKCEHSECGENCGKPCSKCREPCEWKCEHKKCSEECGEECNREPCDEPCPKMLPCGHPCIGFCGEPCPPLCRVCDEEELLEFQVTYDEGREGARFIWLSDCGHTIESEVLEKFLTVETDGEIGVKRCPRCRQTIRQCRRFGNLLKKCFAQIKEVKDRIFGNIKELRKGQRELVAKISGPGWNGKAQKAMTQFLIEALTENAPNIKFNKQAGNNRVQERSRVMKTVDSHHLRSLKAIVHVVSVICKNNAEVGIRSRLVNNPLAGWTRRRDRLFEELINRRQLPLSGTEIRELEQEMTRLVHLSQLYRFEAYESRDQDVKQLFQNVAEILESYQSYTNTKQNHCVAGLKKLEELCKTGLGIPDVERIAVLQAIGMGKGHWFKCPNGHIYAIGDCGGAMEKSKCNECGAEIGGERHALLGNNALASEMDGATAPAWPSALL